MTRLSSNRRSLTTYDQGLSLKTGTWTERYAEFGKREREASGTMLLNSVFVFSLGEEIIRPTIQMYDVSMWKQANRYGYKANGLIREAVGRDGHIYVFAGEYDPYQREGKYAPFGRTTSVVSLDGATGKVRWTYDMSDRNFLSGGYLVQTMGTSLPAICCRTGNVSTALAPTTCTNSNPRTAASSTIGNRAHCAATITSLMANGSLVTRTAALAFMI